VAAGNPQGNTIAACDENTAFAGGEVNGGYPFLVKVS
jgi:hypothetical protein